MKTIGRFKNVLLGTGLLIIGGGLTFLLVSFVADSSPRDEDTGSAPLNVLFITADDLGLQLGAYGDNVVETPNMDKLAASGVQFNIAYIAQASCSPSRSAMFTGLYPHTNGQYGLTATRTSLHPHLHDAVMPNILKRAGYHTGIIGKLHVAPGNKFQFDFNNQSHMDAWDVKRVAELTSEFFTKSGDQPFFLMVNFTDPHAWRERDPETGNFSPWTFLDRNNGVPETLVEPGEKTLWPFQGVDSPVQRTRVAGYYNEVKRLDVGIGLLMDVLEKHGHADNTLIIFIGDHGPPFDRAKTTVYEAGLRIPFLVRWPGVTRPMKSDAMVSTVDILPTVIDATGARPAVSMHGRSLRPVLMDPDAKWREYLAGEFHMHGPPFFPRRAIRDHRYKLIHNLRAGEVKPFTHVDGDIGYDLSRESRYDDTDIRRAFDIYADPPEFELYDLGKDPWEFNNLAGQEDHTEVQERLTQALLEWRRQTEDPFLDSAFLDKIQAPYDQYMKRAREANE
jgi:N-sulfoglucosamine sulfohydrolase